MTSESQITATGVNLELASHSACELTFEGIVADTCTIISSEQITGEFNFGVPLNNMETVATVRLLNDDGIMANFVKNPTLGGVDVDGNDIVVGITNRL